MNHNLQHGGSETFEHMPKSDFGISTNTSATITFRVPSPHSNIYNNHSTIYYQESTSSVFWVKLILVLNAILRYGHLKFFFLWTRKTPLRMASRGKISVRIHRRFLTMHELGSSASVGPKK